MKKKRLIERYMIHDRKAKETGRKKNTHANIHISNVCIYTNEYTPRNKIQMKHNQKNKKVNMYSWRSHRALFAKCIMYRPYIYTVQTNYELKSAI